MQPMRSIFSPALGSKSNKKLNQWIRPNGICTDALANEGMDLDGDHGEISGDELEEGRVIPGKKMVYQPSKAEWDEHMRTHIPF